jgi:hypothetical protein
MYLEHIDLCTRQVQPDIPRIYVWKHDMIKIYFELDKKSPAVYGHRSLHDYDATCYAQV